MGQRMKKPDQKKHPNWGGVRPGQGRTRKGESLRVTRSISISPEILSRIDEYAKLQKLSRSEAIEGLCETSLASKDKAQNNQL